MAYNGGYNMGAQSGFNANQGGYVTSSPNHGDSPATESPQNKKRSGAVNQSLVPVTIKQLINASQAHPDDGFKIDNRELNQVTLVANILSINNLATNVGFVVDDGTGKMDVRIWLDAEDKGDEAAQKKNNWREGTYVRIIGHLRSFHSKRSIVAFRVQPIEDFNELTYHFLEVIYVHLYNSRGNNNTTVTSMQTTNYTAYQKPVYSNTTNMSSLADIHQAVMNVIGACTTSEGVGINFICEQLNRPLEEVRHAIDFLSGEGHLYSTIDEDHFLTTGNV